MYRVATAEREPGAESAVVPGSLFRHARGQKLFGMFSSLIEFDRQNSGIIVPTDAQRRVSPRVIIVKNKEMLARNVILDPGVLDEEGLHEELTSRIPELNEPRKSVVAESLDLQKSRGGYNLSLFFDEKSNLELAEERDKVLLSLEEITGLATDVDGPDWNSYDADMMVMIARSRIPKNVMNCVASFVERQLPLPIDLEPMHNPAQVSNPT